MRHATAIGALALLGASLIFSSAAAEDEWLDAPLPPPRALRPDADQDAPLVSGPVFSHQPQRAGEWIEGISLVVQPSGGDQPEEPVFTPTEIASTQTENTFGGFVDLGALSPARRAEAAGAVSSDVVLGSESEIRNTTDANDLLSNSMSTTGIYLHSRNPISNDIRIRGFRFSQIRGHVNGAYWRPVRQDFDTPLSKIDSSIIRDVIVTKGPYSVRQGAGFAFIDVELQDTPRNEHGSGWGGRTAVTFDTNGDQFNGRQTIWGGSTNYGYRISYGDRSGTDYFSGADFRVASGFKSRDWDFAYGYDLSSDSRIEFNYQRVDQTDVELPSQYFDIDYLTSDSFSLRYYKDRGYWFDHLRVDSWWNRTEYSGNANNKTKRGTARFGLIANNGSLGEVRSTGARAAGTWGDVGDSQLTVGVDYSFVDEEFVETRPTYLGSFGLPRTVTNNPGAFSDLILPINGRTTIKVGGRIDAVNLDLGNGITAPDETETNQSFSLGAGFISLERKVNSVWTATIAGGYAERAPTPTDLYADTFMELVQYGRDTDFRSNSTLNKERLSQLDLGLTFEYEYARGGIHGFAGWTEDYITYNQVSFNAGTGALVLTPHNVDARMVGGEFYGEVDLTGEWTAFGSISYVQGKNRTADIALFGMPPLDSRAGIRYKRPTWAAEFIARMVDNQDRIDPFLQEQATPGFATLDVRAYVKLSDSMKLVAGVENLGNRFYKEHLDTTNELSYGTARGVFRQGTNGYIGLISTY